jgi:rhodanese-related sulfurtransferase
MEVPTLSIKDFNELIKSPDMLVLDIRSAEDFANGFVVGSYFLPDGSLLKDLLAIHDFIDFETLMIIANDKASDPLVNAIYSAFSKKVVGVMYTYNHPLWPSGAERDLIITIDPDELAMDLPFDDKLILIDVRSAIEYAGGHISGAKHFPLEDLNDPANIALIPEDGNLYLYCSDGMRSMLAASVFKKHGLHNLRVIDAIWSNIKATPGLSVEKDAKQLN